jgi:hypothetical protein
MQTSMVATYDKKPKAFKGSLRPMTLVDLNECWQLDLRCFVDGEAYERETFRYLLSNPQTIARQIRSESGDMSAFAIGVIEPDGSAISQPSVWHPKPGDEGSRTSCCTKSSAVSRIAV